jgi:hypothetical protein
MRIARKLILVAAMALVAMAFSAASASAVSVTTEPGGADCPDLSGSTGGCALHANGEVQLQGHLFGVESTSSDCNVELTGRVNKAGVGQVDAAKFTDHAGIDDCTRTECGLPWGATISGTNPTFAVNSTFCVQTSNGTQQTCTVALPITESGHSYSSSFHVAASANTNAPGCEVEGQLALEGTSIELN